MNPPNLETYRSQLSVELVAIFLLQLPTPEVRQYHSSFYCQRRRRSPNAIIRPQPRQRTTNCSDQGNKGLYGRQSANERALASGYSGASHPPRGQSVPAVQNSEEFASRPESWALIANTILAGGPFKQRQPKAARKTAELSTSSCLAGTSAPIVRGLPINQYSRPVASTW
jgi:hypothetical protein